MGLKVIPPNIARAELVKSGCSCQVICYNIQVSAGNRSILTEVSQDVVLQAKGRCLEFVEIVTGGEEVIIFRDKQPLVKLSPIFKQKQERQGLNYAGRRF